MKDEKGITLPVLIITVVIFVIIVGVTVKQLVYENAAPVKSIKNETEYQQNMVQNENKKINGVISDIEEEWGIS